jgi:hypothetical protein
MVLIQTRSGYLQQHRPFPARVQIQVAATGFRQAQGSDHRHAIGNAGIDANGLPSDIDSLMWPTRNGNTADSTRPKL